MVDLAVPVAEIGGEESTRPIITIEIVLHILFDFRCDYVCFTIDTPHNLLILPQHSRIGPHIITPIQIFNKPEHMRKLMNLH